MKTLCVFCGSKVGRREIYVETAKQVGKKLAENGVALVYGGGSNGLMGTVANAVLEGNGTVIGVIPEFMLDELHTNLSEKVVVNTMHERKFIMAEKADAFVALPGGIGTFEEILEMFTWLALKLHHKPVAVLNTDGFYDHFLAQLKQMRDEEFLREEFYNQLIVASNPDDLFIKIAHFIQQRL